MSPAVREKVEKTLTLYSNNPERFVKVYSPETIHGHLTDPDKRDLLITSEKIPSVTIARKAFGDAPIKLILRSHLFELAQATGIQSTAENIDAIIDDIISGYGYLKISEIILALKMMRESKFREGRDGSGNRGTFYGRLDGQVITDCINRFVVEYRNPLLDKVENERRRQRFAEESRNAASYETRKKIISDACRDDPSLRPFLGQFLKDEDNG